MKKIIILLICLQITAFTQILNKETESFIDSLMQSAYKPNLPGAVILVAQDGKSIYKKAYGLAHVPLNVMNKTENVFAIGSISKQFAAVGILVLVQDGKISLNDDIRKFYPDIKTNKTITIENILSHTSGIVSYTEKEGFDKLLTKSIPKRELIDYFINDSLIFEPGTDWSYSNSGYALAADIIEKVSGKTYQDFIVEKIFKPLQMTNTYFGDNSKIIPNSVLGYGVAKDSIISNTTYFSWSWIFGAGDIMSNVEDMLKWNEGLLKGKIITKELLDKAWSSFTLNNGLKANYGLGWSVDEYNNMKVVSHGGSINGYLSDAVIIPEKNIYTIILSNRAGGKNPGELTSIIALKVANNSIINPKIVNVKSKDIEDYSGVYEIHRAGTRLAKNLSKEKMYNYISVKDDTLYIQRTGGSKTPLVCIDKDLFIRKGSNNYFKFKRNAENIVTHLEIYSEPTNYGPNEVEPKTNLNLPTEKAAVKIKTEILKECEGRYDFGGDFIIKIRVEENKIYAQGPGQPEEEIIPESELKYSFKDVDAYILFRKESGKITGLTLHQVKDYEAKKID